MAQNAENLPRESAAIFLKVSCSIANYDPKSSSIRYKRIAKASDTHPITGGPIMSHSYVAIANQLRHRFRDDLNHAEHLYDVDNAFALTIRGLLVQAFDDSLTFTDNDISLTPGTGDGFELAPAIRHSEAFKAAARQSDLMDIIARFAESAAHRRQSLENREETGLRTEEHKQH
jgi:hypothetical protein